jgi:hypothetical protein
MKKDYRPMALGFWGVGVPMGVFGRAAVLVLAAVFLAVGALIYRARR